VSLTARSWVVRLITITLGTPPPGQNQAAPPVCGRAVPTGIVRTRAPRTMIVFHVMELSDLLSEGEGS